MHLRYSALNWRLSSEPVSVFDAPDSYACPSTLAMYAAICQCRTLSLPTLPEALTEEVQNTAGVTPLIVIPGDKLDEVVVESNTCLGIEDGGVGVTVEIGRDNVILGVSHDAWECK
jgi:hypothetical protein